MTRHEYLASGARLTSKRGNDLPQAKLDTGKVRYIRANPKGRTLKQLAAELGVHHRTIQKVHYRETWVHV